MEELRQPKHKNLQHQKQQTNISLLGYMTHHSNHYHILYAENGICRHVSLILTGFFTALTPLQIWQSKKR